MSALQSAGIRTLLGVLTVWASAYAVAALAFDIGFAGPAIHGTAGDELVSLLVRYASAINALLLLLLYAWMALRNPGMRAFDRVAWVFAMMFLYPLTLPIFWYLHVWRTRSIAV